MDGLSILIASPHFVYVLRPQEMAIGRALERIMKLAVSSLRLERTTPNFGAFRPLNELQLDTTCALGMLRTAERSNGF